MNYTIQNGTLSLTVSAHGAEMQALYHQKQPEQSLLWDAKPEIWKRTAPLCFPWCGRIEGNWYEFEGKTYENLPQHGFARDVEHTLVEQTETSLTFRLDWQGDEKLWPWAFTLETRHALEGNVLTTTCTAVNRSEKPMPVQLGFHVGLACPFTPEKVLEDYHIRWEKPEAPGKTDTFILNHHSFDDGSTTFTGLESEWLEVEEKDSGKYLRVDVKGFPYVLLWSPAGVPDFVCIEPWTGELGAGHDLLGRKGAIALAPGESFSRTHRLTVGL